MHIGGIQFQSLRVFCDVARFRSFSRAASANGITQSAASQTLRQIEKRLGVDLVDRSTRPLALTPAGQVFHEGAHNILERLDALEANVRQSGSAPSSSIHVAAIYSVGLRDMNRYVEEFGAAQPGSSVRLDYAHTARVYEKVLGGEADLGLVAWPRKDRELSSIPWRTEEMVVVCAPSHPLAAKKTVKARRLASERFVGFDKGTTIRDKVDRFLRDHQASADIALEFDNIENVKQAIEAGSGISLLPLPTVEKEIKDGSLAVVRLADARFLRPLGIIHRRTRNLNPSVAKFVELLRAPDDEGGSSRRRTP